MKKYFAILTFIIVSGYNLVLAQQQYIGQPKIISFTANEYGGSLQIWNMIQDNRGYVYFGANDGIMAFDGIRWQKITPVEYSRIRGFCKDSQGRIYAAGYNNFGYLSADSLGNLKFVSLMKYFPDSIKDMRNIWKIKYYKNKIYLKTNKRIIQFNPKNKSVESVYLAPTKIYDIFFLDSIYVTIYPLDLIALTDDLKERKTNLSKYNVDKIEQKGNYYYVFYKNTIKKINKKGNVVKEYTHYALAKQLCI